MSITHSAVTYSAMIEQGMCASLLESLHSQIPAPLAQAVLAHPPAPGLPGGAAQSALPILYMYLTSSPINSAVTSFP